VVVEETGEWNRYSVAPARLSVACYLNATFMKELSEARHSAGVNGAAFPIEGYGHNRSSTSFRASQTESAYEPHGDEPACEFP
jgi:hypothetical protein